MLKRMYRQRRRLIFLGLMLGAAFAISVIGNHEFRYQLKHELFGPAWLFPISMVLALLVIVLLASLLLIYLFPSARRVMETAAIAGVLSEAVMHADGVLPEWAFTGAMPWVWFVAFCYLILILLERDVFGSMGLTRRFLATKSRVIDASPDAIWAAIAPEAECIGTQWSKAIAAITPRPDLGAETFDVRYRFGPQLSMMQTHTRRIWTRPFHLLYDFEPSENAKGISGSFEMHCAPQPDGRTKLTLSHDYPAVGWGTWAFLWLDDMVGCEMDAISARLAGRRDWSIAGWTARKMAGV